MILSSHYFSLPPVGNTTHCTFAGAPRRSSCTIPVIDIVACVNVENIVLSGVLFDLVYFDLVRHERFFRRSKDNLRHATHSHLHVC